MTRRSAAPAAVRWCERTADARRPPGEPHGRLGRRSRGTLLAESRFRPTRGQALERPARRTATATQGSGALRDPRRSIEERDEPGPSMAARAPALRATDVRQEPARVPGSCRVGVTTMPPRLPTTSWLPALSQDERAAGVEPARRDLLPRLLSSHGR